MLEEALEYRKKVLLDVAKTCVQPSLDAYEKKKACGLSINNLVGKGIAFTQDGFVTVKGINPKEVAREMVYAFNGIERSTNPNKIADSFNSCITLSGAEVKGNALAKAGSNIAKVMDLGVGAGISNSYHNCQHMIEVMLITQRLAEINNLDTSNPKFNTHDKNLLAVAGLIHDLGHDGKGNCGITAKLELQSFKMAETALKTAGVSEEDMSFLKGALAATCIAPEKGQLNPNKYAIEVHKYNLNPDKNKVPPEQPLGEAYEAITKAFLGKPKASEMCMIVADADLTPSAGLTIEHSDMQGYKLSGEFNPDKPLALNRNTTKFFLDNIVGASFESCAGKLFLNENRKEIEAINNYYLEKGQNNCIPEVKVKDSQTPINNDLYRIALGHKTQGLLH